MKIGFWYLPLIFWASVWAGIGLESCRAASIRSGCENKGEHKAWTCMSMRVSGPSGEPVLTESCGCVDGMSLQLLGGAP